MPVDKQMQSLVDGWYFADESFAKPGVYVWNGKENVHVQTELSTLRSDNNRLRAEVASLKEDNEQAYISLAIEGVRPSSLSDGIADLTQQLAAAKEYAERLREAIEPVIRISDRKHDAWDAAKAALSDLPEADKNED